jgi:Domain of unknown function (DUF4262)
MTADDDYFITVRKIVSEHGVMIQAVGGGDSVDFAYTVGLAEIEEPELIIFGLPPNIAQDILNDLALPIVRGQAERSLSPGPGGYDIVALDNHAFGDVPAWLIEVKDSSEHLTVANAMFAVPGQGPIHALQIVYPDKNGLWPWTSGSQLSSLPLLGDQP